MILNKVCKECSDGVLKNRHRLLKKEQPLVKKYINKTIDKINNKENKMLTRSINTANVKQYKYIMENNKKIGFIVQFKNGRYGWSLCKDRDIWNENGGFDIAYGRAKKWPLSHIISDLSKRLKHSLHKHYENCKIKKVLDMIFDMKRNESKNKKVTLGGILKDVTIEGKSFNFLKYHPDQDKKYNSDTLNRLFIDKFQTQAASAHNFASIANFEKEALKSLNNKSYEKYEKKLLAYPFDKYKIKKRKYKRIISKMIYKWNANEGRNMKALHWYLPDEIYKKFNILEKGKKN